MVVQPRPRAQFAQRTRREISSWLPASKSERLGLWEYDVVEAFIGSEPQQINSYTEFEWAPTGETLDLKLNLPEKNFDWTAGGESAVSIDESAKVWRVEARLPLSALSDTAPQPGTRWKINL